MTHLVFDTNILLLDAYNLINIAKSMSPKPIVVLPETVLDELDSKKSGFTEIAYQARQFGRLLSKANKLDATTSIDPQGRLLTTTALELEGIEIWVLSIDQYPSFTGDEPNIRNDRKILHITHLVARKFPDTVFCSNDVMCRIRAESMGIKSIDHKLVDDTELNFIRSLTIDSEIFSNLHNMQIIEVDLEYKPEYYNYVFTDESTGQVKLANLRNGLIDILGKETEAELRRQDVPPANSGQLFLSRAIQNPAIDIVLVESLAGSGKTVTAISNAIQLVKKGKYKSITYIRTSNSDLPKEEEIGFLAGNEDKLAPFLHPLEDTLQFIARSNHKDSKLKGREYEEMISEKVEKLRSDCSISGMIAQGMRGRTFTDTVAIIDEAQNSSKSSLQKILTRFGRNCKIILIGSNKQIDNQYVTKYTNGLSVLLDACRTHQSSIRLHAVELTKVLRSPVAEFVEKLFHSKA